MHAQDPYDGVEPACEGRDLQTPVYNSHIVITPKEQMSLNFEAVNMHIKEEPVSLDMTVEDVKCEYNKEENEAYMNDPSHMQTGASTEIAADLTDLQSVIKFDNAGPAETSVSDKVKDEESCTAQIQKCLDTTAGMIDVQHVKNEDAKINEIMSVQLNEEKENEIYPTHVNTNINASVAARTMDLPNQINQDTEPDVSGGIVGTHIKIEKPDADPVTSFHDDTLTHSVCVPSSRVDDTGDSLSESTKSQSWSPSEYTTENSSLQTQIHDGINHGGSLCHTEDLFQGVDHVRLVRMSQCEENDDILSMREQKSFTNEEVHHCMTSDTWSVSVNHPVIHVRMLSSEKGAQNVVRFQSLPYSSEQNKDLYRDTATQMNYHCPTCGKLFKRKANLTKHVEIHTQEVDILKDAKSLKNEELQHCMMSDAQLVSANLPVIHYVHMKILSSENERETPSIESIQKVPCCVEENKDLNMDTATQMKYHCATPGKLFRRKGNFTRHKEAHTHDLVDRLTEYQQIQVGDMQHQQMDTASDDKTANTVAQSGHKGTLQSQKQHHCATCNKRFAYNCLLKRHMRTHKAEKPYQCKICGKSFAQNVNVKIHMRSHTGQKPYQCIVCDKRFTYNQSMNKHMKTHAGQKPYKCTICIESFASNRDKKKHMKSHSDEKPYQCSTCNKRFAIHCRLKAHVRTHTGEKPCQCTMCGKQFANISKLKIHRKTHTGEKPYHCTICDKRFADSSSMSKHRRIHTGEKPWHCTTCGKQFGSSGQLKMHRRTHTGEKPYHCATCGRRFADRSALRRHQRTHTGEKPCQCTTCGKQFTNSSQLKIHKRSHTGEKPYHCATCDKSFADRSTLLTHQRTHTGEKPFCCSSCGKRFGRKDHLKRHMHTHTS